MIRTTLDNVTVKRTCKPLHEQHQATPYAIHLDDAAPQTIYSGMVMARTGEDTVDLYDGTSATVRPFGLAALDYNTDINDMDGLSDVPFAVWLGGPDAFFQINAPAFDTGATWAVPTDGTRQLVYANADGELTTVADGEPVAELIEVVSASRIVIRLWPFAANAVA